jgi:hypothetical protein
MFQNGIQKMRLTLLILLTLLLPAAWGYCMYWLIAKWWPPRNPDGGGTGRCDLAPAPHDYQI